MKRALLIIFVLLLLCSCDIDYHSPSIDSNKTEMSVTLGSVLYVVNKNTRTYHLPSCRYAWDIDEEYRWETYDINFLTSHQVNPCGICVKGKH